METQKTVWRRNVIKISVYKQIKAFKMAENVLRTNRTYDAQKPLTTVEMADRINTFVHKDRRVTVPDVAATLSVLLVQIAVS